MPLRLDSYVRDTVAEQVAPIAQLDADLARRWSIAFDADAARARVRAGRVAFESAEVIAGAGSLVVPFVRATVALERAGLAADDEAMRARERRAFLPGLVRAWLAGEPMPRERVRATARRAAGVVASSILRRAAALVRGGAVVAGWRARHCPCCGGPADFSLCADGDRTLLCARCDTRWSTPARGCLGCGEREAPTLARIPWEALGCDLAICNACGRYVKERAADPAVEPLVERVLTAQLDAAAEARGLRL